MKLWQEYTTPEKIKFLIDNTADKYKPETVPEAITHELVNQCVTALSQEDRKTYIEHITAEASDITYSMPDIDPGSEEATNLFYWIVHSIDAERKAEKVWAVLIKYDV